MERGKVYWFDIPFLPGTGISPCLLILGKMAGCVSWSLEILARHGVESGVLPGKLFRIRKRNLSFAVTIP